MERFVSGDHHFEHDGILDIVNRPFRNSTENTRKLIKLHNDKVPPTGITYFVGDFFWFGIERESSLRKILSKMNGTKILILGNHDRIPPLTYVECGFQSVHTYFKIYDFNMVHDPAISVVLKDEVWLCAHVHTLFKHIDNRVINVGVDVRNYEPLSFDEVNELTDVKYKRENLYEKNRINGSIN